MLVTQELPDKNLIEVPDTHDLTRPHYPYSLWAKYRGSGDPNDYRNFEPVDPEQQ